MPTRCELGGRVGSRVLPTHTPRIQSPYAGSTAICDATDVSRATEIGRLACPPPVAIANNRARNRKITAYLRTWFCVTSVRVGRRRAGRDRDDLRNSSRAVLARPEELLVKVLGAFAATSLQVLRTFALYAVRHNRAHWSGDRVRVRRIRRCVGVVGYAVMNMAVTTESLNITARGGSPKAPKSRMYIIDSTFQCGRKMTITTGC